MFGLLKSKLTNFIKGLTGREEKKPGAAQPAQINPEQKGPEQEKPEEQKPQAHSPPPVQEQAGQKAPPQKQPEQKQLEQKQQVHVQQPEQKTHPAPVPVLVHQKPHEHKMQPAPPSMQQKQPPPAQEVDLSHLEKKASGEKRGLSPKIGLGTAIRSFFSNEITIGESEVSDLVEELELELLEADVAYDVSLEVASQLRSKLVGMKVPKGQVEERTREAVRTVLESVMDSGRKFDFVSRVRQLPKPAKILFVGPNGAGKTTTMAKVARMLMDAGLSAVFSASDTFRAAAIEQTEVHGLKLGVKVIKSRYGADPASVAFDAVNFARSHSIDVVLIDSAGRQDTNANLLSELKKINRVAQPDLKIYVGESIGGNALLDQIRAFNEAIGIDGAILTKLDCDAKGGTAISLAHSTGIPVLFLGVGQQYSDLVPFDPRKVAQEILT